MLVEVGDGLGVVGLELRVGNLIHPRVHYLPEDLAACLAPDRISDDPDGVLRFDEAE